MYKGMCVGGVVPLVRLGVGCVRVSLYIDACVLVMAAFRGSYNGVFGVFLWLLWYLCADVSTISGDGHVVGVWLCASV